MAGYQVFEHTDGIDELVTDRVYPTASQAARYARACAKRASGTLYRVFAADPRVTASCFEALNDTWHWV